MRLVPVAILVLPLVSACGPDSPTIPLDALPAFSETGRPDWASPRREELVIDNELGTFSYWVGLSYDTGGDPPSRFAAGQTFTAHGVFLNRFSFWVERRGYNGGPFPETYSEDQTFTPHVGRWDVGTNRVSEVLWSGEPRNDIAYVQDVPEQLWFTTGHLDLTPGGVFVAYLTYSGSVPGYFGIKRGSDTYAGGSIANRGSLWNVTSDEPLGGVSATEDAYDFRAVFIAAPPSP